MVDLNTELMTVGQSRSEKLGYNGSGNINLIIVLKWEVGNAEELKEPDGFYDFYTIAFGIRNVTNRKKALKEG